MKKRKQRKKLDLNAIPLASYVFFSIALLIIFTVLVLVLSIFNILVPDSLITCFFSAFGGEFLVCGLIKVFKLKKQDTEQLTCSTYIGEIEDDRSELCAGGNSSDNVCDDCLVDSGRMGDSLEEVQKGRKKRNHRYFNKA